MQKYEAIEQGIAENNIKLLRQAIGNIIYTNRNFSNGEFDEVVSYVIGKGIMLKDSELCGKLISDGKVNFNEDDFADAIFELKENFCDERIEDVKRIGKALYPSEKPLESKPVKGQVESRNPNIQSHQKSTNSPNIIPILVGIIVIVILIAVILFWQKK